MPSETPKTPAPAGKLKRLRLTLDQDLKLLQFCLQSSSTFGRSKRLQKWWDKVAENFNGWLRQGYTNHQHHVDHLVKKRLEFLARLGTGDEDEKGPYKDAIDDWI